MTAAITSSNSAVNRDCLTEFVSRFEKLSGRTYLCSSEKEVAHIIEKLVKERANGRSYFAREVLEFIKNKAEESFSDSQMIGTAERFNPPDNIDGLEVLKEADLGITTADFAIAETGCLVEVAYSDSSKLLSSLTRVNIILLRAKDVLPSLQEFAPVLRKLLSSDDKPTITLISGPSRTSDIEMKFVLGVHGPHEVHAIILK
jgi:L-lactate utilization protein LutC